MQGGRHNSWVCSAHQEPALTRRLLRGTGGGEAIRDAAASVDNTPTPEHNTPDHPIHHVGSGSRRRPNPKFSNMIMQAQRLLKKDKNSGT